MLPQENAEAILEAVARVERGRRREKRLDIELMKKRELTRDQILRVVEQKFLAPQFVLILAFFATFFFVCAFGGGLAMILISQYISPDSSGDLLMFLIGIAACALVFSGCILGFGLASICYCLLKKKEKDVAEVGEWLDEAGIH